MGPACRSDRAVADPDGRAPAAWRASAALEPAQAPNRWRHTRPPTCEGLSSRLDDLIEIADTAFEHRHNFPEDVLLERVGGLVRFVPVFVDVLFVEQQLPRIFRRLVHHVELAARFRTRQRNHLLENVDDFLLLALLDCVLLSDDVHCLSPLYTVA